MNSVYIVLTHRYRPINSGPNKGKWTATEECSFLTDIPMKTIQEATSIIDLVNQKIIKSRAVDKYQDGAFEQLLGYIKTNYGEKYLRLLEVTGIDDPLAEKKDEEPVEDNTD